MSGFLNRFGPAMMMAATAVGVSHLVYSTQAGADYGFSLAWLIILIVVLKYPAFRFAVDYANATEQSLVTAYSKISKVAMAWLAVGFFVDMFIATGALSLVTAGLVISVFDIPFSGPQVAVGLMVLTAIVLLNGQYQKAERLVKILVLAFSVLAVAATLFALPLLGSDDRGVFATLTPDRSLLIFVIAMAGWMPMPTNGAILYSKWVCERKKLDGDRFDFEVALSDFRNGYGLTLVLALCFVAMGTAVLFETGRQVPATAAGFATELFGIFTTVIGNWSYPIIAAAGVAVIWSSQVALMDALPRVSDRLVGILQGRPADAPSRFRLFSAIQVVGVSIMLLFMMRNFTSFIYFATSMGFVAGPAIAYYNYRAVTSDDVPEENRPSQLLIIWNWISVIVLTAFAVAYLWTSLS
ncbi:MAG: divalent metal cation transporter [Woeseiaceae bacterium]|nr:divalent metal cation transporter [Woeseiaceae bacterium]